MIWAAVILTVFVAVVCLGLWLRARANWRASSRENERLKTQLASILDCVAAGIVATDSSGNCTVTNRAAGEILGVPAGALIGASIVDHGVDVADFVTNDPVTRDGVFRRRDGSTVAVEYSVAPLPGGGAVITFNDTTRRRRLEARLEQANRVASLGRLAATVAHEFNNVLMGIQPFADLLHRDISSETRIKAAGHIGRSIQRGKRIAQDILRFTQPAQLERSAVDVAVLLETLKNEVESVVATSYELVVDVEGRLFIDGDRNQLIQVLINLVLNARDAMPKGGRITITARRERADARFPFGAVASPDRFVHLVVADTGSGMSAEVLDHIFEPLFTTKHSGTGLGLSVVHQVVQRHGGEVFVESAPGAGTTFHLFLPAAEDTTDPRQTVAQAEPTPQWKVLVVEDETSVAAGIAELLTLENMIPEVAYNAAEAVEALHRSTPDVVILDIGLPDADGLTVYERILALHPSMPVIFSTGHVTGSQLDEPLRRRSTRLLEKPYTSDALLEVIRELVTGPMKL